MSTALLFPPPRRDGLIFQISASLLLLGGGTLAFIEVLQAQAGPVFLFYLFIALALYTPLPILLYRTYALTTCSYAVERDGLRIRWGLRSEDIPLNEIEWVRPASDLVTPLARPWLVWPGALLGERSVRDLGPVEFLASTTSTLLLVAAAKKVFAISPADPEAFLRAFARTNELGSLTPLNPQSIYPTFLLARVWYDRLARGLLAAGLAAGILLLVWVSLVIPARPTIALGFNANGSPVDAGPSVRLLLLPVLDGLAFLIDLIAGLFFYRQDEAQTLSYILWASAVVSGLLMLGAVFFITVL